PGRAGTHRSAARRGRLRHRRAVFHGAGHGGGGVGRGRYRSGPSARRVFGGGSHGPYGRFAPAIHSPLLSGTARSRRGGMKWEPSRFVSWFRHSSPYLNAHRGRTFVVAFGGETVADGTLPTLIHDLALLNSLGVRLVLVPGARPQIEQR